MQQQLKLWELISASKFEIPEAPADEAARDQSRRLWRWFHQQILRRSEEVEAGESTESRNCTADELDASCPKIDWYRAARGLEADLKRRLENRASNDSPSIALVGPPGCGIPELVKGLARELQLTMVPAPPPKELLCDEAAHSQILQTLDTSNATLAMPRLERFFLRHEVGLSLVRSVVERLSSRGRVLFGCDSWAWAFLQRAIGIEDLIGPPLTLAPFDDSRLDAWFRSSYDLQSTEFLHRRDDEPVFLDDAGNAESRQDEQDQKTSKLMKVLAARARGNLGVAHALWQHSLRICETASNGNETAEKPSHSTLWVVSPSDLEPPKISNGVESQHRFILHALLLHAGLSLATLDALLPFSREDICRRLSELQDAGCVRVENHLFRISLAAYPEVRQDLDSEGFLTDAF